MLFHNRILRTVGLFCTQALNLGRPRPDIKIRNTSIWNNSAPKNITWLINNYGGDPKSKIYLNSHGNMMKGKGVYSKLDSVWSETNKILNKSEK